MRVALLLIAAAAACASAPRDASSGIEVEGHAFEVPRNPYPAYHPDGVVVTRLDGDTAWTRGGLLVQDVIETVNGEWTLDPDAFRRAVGANAPRKMRIVGSRAGPVGQYRIVAIEVG